MKEDTREEKFARKYALIQSVATLLARGIYTQKEAVRVVLATEKDIEKEIYG